MLNELKQLLLKQETGVTEHNPLEVGDLLEENAILRQKVDKLQSSLDSSLDELVLCQKRIDALLRQLKDKNGGR